MTLMLEDADLDAAVAEGILSASQATSLRELARRRESERAAALGHEERFRFMRGFNDVFFAIGVALLGFGIAYFAGGGPAGMAGAAASMWLLAELLVRRMRLVLPGILLAGFFVGFLVLAAPTDYWFGTPMQRPASAQSLSLLDQLRYSPALLLKALAGALAAAAFYARFRLPFALLPLAGSLVAVTLAAASLLVPPGATALLQSPILLACGFGVFAAAMAFDSSDRERLTPRADCAFWLHLLAAPLIVHSLVSFVTDNVSRMTPTAALAILAIVAVLTIVAVAIDRRALLVSGLSYLGIVIGYAIAGAAGGGAAERPAVIPATLVVLGAVVLTLGVGWVPIRRTLLSLSPRALAKHLPPVPAPS